MRVALVTYAMNAGGMETFLLSLAVALRERGIRADFFETELTGPWHNRPAEMGFFIGHGLAPPWMGRILASSAGASSRPVP